jgi:hypothetical protein
MRTFNQFLSLAPAPLFAIGALYSVLNPSMCGNYYEMTAMWCIMALAHVTPWLLFYQQHFARD